MEPMECDLTSPPTTFHQLQPGKSDSGVTYLGCFEGHAGGDNLWTDDRSEYPTSRGNDPVIIRADTNPPLMTIVECAKRCAMTTPGTDGTQVPSQYFAVDGSSCMCSNEMPDTSNPVDATECSGRCPGDFSQQCGGCANMILSPMIVTLRGPSCRHGPL